MFYHIQPASRKDLRWLTTNTQMPRQFSFLIKQNRQQYLNMDIAGERERGSELVSNGQVLLGNTKFGWQHSGKKKKFWFSSPKNQILVKVEGKRRRGWQGMRWLGSITDSMDTNVSKFWVMVEDRGARHAAVHRVAKSWTQVSEWSTTAKSEAAKSLWEGNSGQMTITKSTNVYIAQAAALIPQPF